MIFKTPSLIAAVFGASIFGIVQVATAEDYKLGELRILDPWAGALPAVSINGAAYVTLENHGSQPDRLISADSGIAAKTQIHESIMADGMMKMRHVEAVEIPAGGLAQLKPGSYHIMLMGLKEPLTEGSIFPVSLQFEHAGSIEVEVEVRSLR